MKYILIVLMLTGCASTPLKIEYPDGKPLQSIWGERDIWIAYCESLGYDGDLNGAWIEKILIYNRKTLDDASDLEEMNPTIAKGRIWTGACRYQNSGKSILYFANWRAAVTLMRHEMNHARLYKYRNIARLALNQRHGHPSWEKIEHARGAEWPK